MNGLRSGKPGARPYRLAHIAWTIIAMLIGIGVPPACWAGDQALPAHKPKVALALGGGGTRGAAHVGVLRVLEQEGIPVDMVVGTSMGSIVGGLYCAGVSVDELEAMFDKQTVMKNFMTVSLPVRLAAVPIFAIPHLFGWNPYDGFYFGNKLRKYLNSSLPEDRREIEKLKLPFAAVTTNLLDGQPHVITRGNVSRAMQASSAVPVLRRPVLWDENGLLVDGAMVANVPVVPARELGADFVIAVDVDERLCRVPDSQFRKIGSVSKRIEQVYLARADAVQLKRADVVIHPNVDGIGLLSTKISDAKAAIRAGEAATRAAIPEIRARLNLKPATVSQPQDNRLPD